MSTALPPRPRLVSTKTTRICIVASKYNEQYTDALVENTVAELGALIPQGRIDLIRVPGAFEIPVMVSAVLKHDPPACVIALGLILRGSTNHAELISTSVTESLQQLAVEYIVPVIHEVLLVTDEKQARARCISPELNRGREAARAAASIVQTFSELERIGRHPHAKKSKL